MASDRIEEERWSSMQRAKRAMTGQKDDWEVHHIPPVPVEEMTEEQFIAIIKKNQGDWNWSQANETTWRTVWRNRDNPEELNKPAPVEKVYTEAEVLELLEWIQTVTNRTTDRYLQSKISAKSLLEEYNKDKQK